MGSSAIGHVPHVIKHVVLNQPKSILDVGIGFGRWGFLRHETLKCFTEENRWKLFHLSLRNVNIGVIINVPNGGQWLRETGHDNKKVNQQINKPDEAKEQAWIILEQADGPPEIKTMAEDI